MVNIIVHELSVKVYMLKDVSAEDSLEKIAALIDSSFIGDESKEEFHKARMYKGYTFNSFYPHEEKVYKEGNIYTVRIRSIDGSIVSHFRKTLSKQRTEELQALTINHKILPSNHIEKIYSTTPVVCTFEGGYWRPDKKLNKPDTNISIINFENRLKINALKKYSFFTGETLTSDIEIFKSLKILNNFPIVKKYKGVELLCDKVELDIEDSRVAQRVAQVITACGLAEKNARGFGFVNVKTLQDKGAKIV
jgi:CRISPR-associated endoribonuclease Cas6